jgi:hypothetical protein
VVGNLLLAGSHWLFLDILLFRLGLNRLEIYG